MANPDTVKELTNELKGKLIVCSTFVNESATKHHICHVGPGETLRAMNVFTISREGSDSAYGIFEIDRYTLDKNGHLMLIVKPVCPLKDFNYNALMSAGFIPLLKTGLFAEPYCGVISDDFANPNYEALTALVASKGKDTPDVNLACFELLKEGVITFTDISQAVSRPAKYVETIERIRFQTIFETQSGLAEEYPLLMRRMKTLSSEKSLTPGSIMDYIHRLLKSAVNDPKFAESGLSEVSFEKDPAAALTVAEWMCVRYEDIKAEKKAEKKAARKAARK